MNQVSHRQVTRCENLVAKQQAERKPTGLWKSEMSIQSSAAWEREDEGRPTDKTYSWRHHTLLSQFQSLLLFGLASHRPLHSLHLSFCHLLSLIHFRLSPFLHLFLPASRSLSDADVYFNMSHQITPSPKRNCKSWFPIRSIWLS